MYIYNKENGNYIFNGDFEEYLISIGVDKNHIENMQRKLLQADRGRYHEFPEINSPERNYIALVPLDKVIGTCRGSVGQSVYDNVRIMRRGSREPERFEGCLDFLNKMSLDELKQSYANLFHPVHMTYYIDEDEYYLHNDGNHRTLTAMLLGAKYIKATVTNAYLNLSKKEKCECAEAFEQKYGIYRILASGNIFDITFQDKNGYYEVKGYSGPDYDEDLFAFVDRLSRTIDEEKAFIEELKKLSPTKQQMVLKKEKNPRLEKLLNKEYLSDRDLCILYYRRPIHLDRL